MQTIYCRQAFIGGVLQKQVKLTIDQGMIAGVEIGADIPADTTLYDTILPGIANVHSHAFQRAMAGLAEYQVPGRNSFWGWRQAMYSVAGAMTPMRLKVIASQLYVEMIKAGYTAVGEFHYLHNSHKGEQVDMASAVIGAAQSVGLPITYLPVLYQTSDFGAEAALHTQAPFLHTTDDFLNHLSKTRALLSPVDQMGMAIHSLRAVPMDVVKEVTNQVKTGPIHIHIAEQMQEVESCREYSGQRPVDYLLSSVDVNDRWTCIHATHMTDAEITALAKSGAVAGICPTTEANLGDGFFKTPDYLVAGGAIAIGSDSHVSIDPREELRQLDYVERLQSQTRCVLAGSDARYQGHVGNHLYHQAATGGAQSMGQNTGNIAVGKRADLIALDHSAQGLIGVADNHILDAFIFKGQPNPVRHVMIAGEWVVKDYKHAHEDEITSAYSQVMADLQVLMQAKDQAKDI